MVNVKLLVNVLDALPKSETGSGDGSEKKDESESSTITCNAIMETR